MFQTVDRSMMMVPTSAHAIDRVACLSVRPSVRQTLLFPYVR